MLMRATRQTTRCCGRRLLCLQADYNGRTTLHLAVAENRTDVVHVLLDKGSKTELFDTWGNTPLSDALTNHRVEISAALMGKGVSTKVCMKQKHHEGFSWTGLFCTVYESVRALLEQP